MEFRCEKCQHVGPAAQSLMTSDGVVLVCENCGHASMLAISKAAPTSTSASAPTSTAAPTSRPAAQTFADEAFARFLPEPGDGPRCPKCAHLVAADDEFCGRCGLQLDDAYKFPPGHAPWERPPAGKEAAWEQARLLWSALEDRWDDERFERFAGFIREYDLHDFAARRLRFRLIQHPDDPNALALLREIAGSMHSRMMVAKAQAQASSAEFSDVTQRARNVLLWTSLVFWLMILVVLLTRYMC